ncbi:FimB/Mfa2 family fimbrial subunit [Chitinophaga pendula]|uniref:FimB/Mfa2 family fimbrial subunit n=1 Tax=Chitinophaga TaxID=79328 RepID=UPI000BAED5B6|nr:MULTISPECIES: FimB/Mfa2 family fimbrial subunit [Chitinophaga]ASZ12410.1 hypothetical protein CK934_16310 [Chitinophaga sp. MD30]UCJ09993.1 FimB/Mfa2 family fimbrial subunit [Chitinophaga pendula]
MPSFSIHRMLLLALIACMCFISCKDKEDLVGQEPGMEGPLYTVQLEVGHGDSVSAPGDIGTDSSKQLQQQIKQLYFLVYNARGVRVRTVSQRHDQDSFGRVALQLPVGDYTVVVTGEQFLHNRNAYIDGDRYETEQRLPLPTAYISTENMTTELTTTELFFRKFPLSVRVGMVSQPVPVPLRRIVGRLEVNVTDLPRKGVFSIAVSRDLGRFNFATEQVDSAATGAAATEQGAGIRAGEKIGYVYVLNTAAPFNVTISGMDTSRLPWVAYTKTIRNVRCYPNQRTILSGKVFTRPDNIVLLEEVGNSNKEYAAVLRQEEQVLVSGQPVGAGSLRVSEGWSRDSIMIRF